MAMKNLFRILKNNLFQTGLLLLIISLIIISGCMETIAPSSVNPRKLTVYTYIVNTSQPDIRVPVSQAPITVSSSSNPALYSTNNTNASGSADFTINVPLNGSNFDISAKVNGTTQIKSKLLLCADSAVVFIFDTTLATQVDCGNLGGNKTLVFTDDAGNTKIKQNTPKNINKYDKCWNLSNPVGNPNPIVVKIPTVTAPFQLESILLNSASVSVINNTVSIPPGGTLAVCFSVSTVIPKTSFDLPLVFGLTCGTQTGNFNLTLDANIVAPTCDCDPARSSINMQLSDRVQKGNTANIQNVVYTNDLSCPIVVDKISFNENVGWKIISPVFPQTVNPGSSLSISASFTSPGAGKFIDTLRLSITPQGSASKCTFDVILGGSGCSPSCPLLSFDGTNYNVFVAKVITDTLAQFSNGRVFVSLPGNTNKISGTFHVKNPDSACSEVNVGATISYNDIYASQFFTLSPQTFTLNPGDDGIFTVTFTAPDIQTLTNIVTARGKTGKATDSSFSINITIQSGNCTQIINVTSIVTAFPGISPIINLRAYNQKTTLKPDPENEVYLFGDGARTINKGAGGTPGEYPPLKGNIWVDVANNDATSTPPQEPILKTNKNIGMKIWKNEAEALFSDVGTTFQSFVNDANNKTGYSVNPLTGLKVGDVVAFQINNNLYALIYIRRIDNGTEATSSKQTGIEFRSIYPIILP